MKILKIIACFFGFHEWTCKAEQGIKPTLEQLRSFSGFKEYSKMYCANCCKPSKLNSRL